MAETQEFYQISLKLLLKNQNGEVLLLKGLDTGTFSGFYELPGGRIDIDEFQTPYTDILKREASEELGDVNIEISSTPVAIGRHMVLAKHTGNKIKDVPIMYIFFEGKYINGNIEISNEHSGHQWVDLDSVDLEKYFRSGILEGLRMYLKK